MSIQDKFNAAINVIRSLPKNGSYQPSNELLLRFYAYFKQGTIGRNYQPKPSFWDVVNKAKWQAWADLGDMPKEQAMQEYVNELKKIVETMAYTNPVADFVSRLDSFYESVSIDDLEMVVGPIERKNSIENVDASSTVSINEHQSTGDTDIDDEECFHDVMESTGDLKKINSQKVNQYLKPSDYIDHSVTANDSHIPVSQQNGTSLIQTKYSKELVDDFRLQIRNTLSIMRRDMEVLNSRISRVELKLNEITTRDQTNRKTSKQYLYQMLFLMGWPIVFQLLFVWFQKRRKPKGETFKMLSF
ncbi:Acyl-CoA-binding protein, ACBP, conserved site,Acyl-CoA-binding protein, ACBP,FERM/acyl-CoA-binding [Cinara cedri]|uniref:Acyl-CoA-binding protein, ACBP, conserved site,Acyl-CoA-binding protein, ACBP,FERM/acyl-CoA-binding n=1 Tax=Cinara cedri TaxID=506608 RepID=A0A5E4NF00_9HEMI|nr:Acyl-CoA-binding protein, ACBP, conserved site,Acyl-CoA-binding protein, ACBP,FERM/acyl-CoA-binding [Cinara cedri]